MIHIIDGDEVRCPQDNYWHTLIRHGDKGPSEPSCGGCRVLLDSSNSKVR